MVPPTARSKKWDLDERQNTTVYSDGTAKKRAEAERPRPCFLDRYRHCVWTFWHHAIFVFEVKKPPLLFGPLLLLRGLILSQSFVLSVCLLFAG